MFHICLYAGEGGEIVFYQLLGLLATDVQAVGKSEDGDAVDDAKVGTFCHGALVAINLFQSLFEYLGCRGCMDVVLLAEGVDHVLVFTQMRHHAKLYLTVVGAEEQATLFRDECLAYLLAVLITDGYVLQVGVAARQSSGGCHRLIERGVYVPCVWVDKFGKGVDIGAQQFSQSSVFQYFAHYQVLVCQGLKHLFVGNVLSRLGFLGLLHQLQFAKENVAHLFG